MSASPEAADPAHMWLRHCEADTKVPVEGEVVGTIPKWLNGRLVRNGPGEMRIGQSHYKHLFDGMALLHMVNIQDGKAMYSSRFLESEAYKTNHRANRIIFSEAGTAGVPDPCLGLYDKCRAWFLPPIKSDSYTDNCLVNVLQVKDELLAMTETSTVRIVDPQTLETKPEKLKYAKYVSVHRATAHPHVEADGMVYNLGFIAENGPMNYVMISLRDGKIQEAKVVASIPSRWKLHPGYMHSFGITENYFVLSETPLAIDVKQLFLPSVVGISTMDAIKYYEKETTRFRIISRKTGEELKTNYFAPEFFNFHYLNCFESNGNIIIDVCATSGKNVISCLYVDNLKKDVNDQSKKTLKVEPKRYVFPVENVKDAPVEEELLKNVAEAKISRDDFLASASAIKQSNGDVFVKGVAISEAFMELPRINYKYNSKPYTYAYGAHLSDIEKFTDFDGIIKVNVRTGVHQVWQDKDYYSSEPVFVAAPESSQEDDGVILTILLHKTNHRKLSFLVLDAKTLAETARVNFTANGVVTPTFHGQYIAANEEFHGY